MMSHESRVNGAELLAGLIARWSRSGDTPAPVFHVPGEGALELLDALAEARPALRLITCRHEGGMAYMAQAAGQVRDLPGIAVVGRAPGALNAALALHTAWTDAAPMILIVGQASEGQSGREAFLGADFRQALAPMAKWVGHVTDAARLPEAMQRAWSTALSGQRGPVVLIVAEDVWHQQVPDPAPLPRPAPVRAGAAPAAVAEIAARLARAARPVAIVGGTGWQAADLAALQGWAEAQAMPVVTSYRRRDLLDADSPAMCGEVGIGADPALTALLAEADLLLVAGMRLGEINTFAAGGFGGYRLLDAPVPAQALIHVHPDLSELNRVYRADPAICADPGGLFRALDPAAPVPEERAAWRDRLRAARLAFTTGKPCPGPLDLRAVCAALAEALPEDAIVTTGAGAYAHWPQRYLPHRRPGTCLGPKSGTMGYGLPAAIGAQASLPGRRVVAFAGDGCFLMHGEELATAALYKLPVLTIVVNNSSFGAIAANQQRAFGRTTGTDLAPVDFATYAAAMGVPGHRVARTADFAPALRAALAADGPALIELVTGPEAMKP